MDFIAGSLPIVMSVFFGGLAGGIANVFYQVVVKREVRKNEFKSLRDEARLNRDYTKHNAVMASWNPGPQLFIPFRIAATERLLLSGAFEIMRETREIGSKYLENLDHVNAMIRRVEAVLTNGDYKVVVDAIGRYCSGKMDIGQDGQARGLPSIVEKWLSHLEATYRKELNP